MTAEPQARLRALPSVDSLLTHPDAAGLIGLYGRAETVRALRAALDQARRAIRNGDEGALPPADVLRRAAARLAQTHAPTLRPVINATGMIVHTNLGRAPLSARKRGGHPGRGGGLLHAGI